MNFINIAYVYNDQPEKILTLHNVHSCSENFIRNGKLLNIYIADADISDDDLEELRGSSIKSINISATFNNKTLNTILTDYEIISDIRKDYSIKQAQINLQLTFAKLVNINNKE